MQLKLKFSCCCFFTCFLDFVGVMCCLPVSLRVCCWSHVSSCITSRFLLLCRELLTSCFLENNILCLEAPSRAVHNNNNNTLQGYLHTSKTIQPEPEPKPKPQAETDPEAHPEDEPEAEPETEPEYVPELESDPDPKPGPDFELKPGTEPHEPEPELESHLIQNLKPNKAQYFSLGIIKSSPPEGSGRKEISP